MALRTAGPVWGGGRRKEDTRAAESWLKITAQWWWHRARFELSAPEPERLTPSEELEQPEVGSTGRRRALGFQSPSLSFILSTEDRHLPKTP